MKATSWLKRLRDFPRFVVTQPPEVLSKLARARRAHMRSHPWLVDLSTPGDPEERVERFMKRDGEIHGIPVRVVELTGDAGDVILVHPWLLHVRPVNAGNEPRFLLAKDLHRRASRPPTSIENGASGTVETTRRSTKAM